ncbi:sialate:O-sulfotransferase 1-like [Penaeus indicus]|uniref:sialate:O-sulfotransferase 1-like n=1 Tax=Penaeus indicus TaxID=29960 RepID=UPI00300C8EF4
MHLFLKTLYMLTVMVMTGIMMLLVLLCTPDFHTRLSSGFYRQTDLSYSQFVMQSLDNPGIYVAEVAAEDQRVDTPVGAPVKRETAWDYRGNNTGYLKIHIDYARPQHEPWAGTDCMGVRVAFARRRTLPRTALASFPGSGNTWLRYLIQSTTGLFTGSVYNDPQLASKGFYGENETPECGCTIVVKTHGYSLGGRPESRDKRLKEMNKFFGRGLLLVRNPFDTLIAYRNFLSAGHLGVAGPTAFRGPAWDRFVRNEIELWKSYAVDWITLSRSSHVVHYEHLLEDPRKELLKILHFLRIRVDNRRFQCVLKNLSGAFKRTTPNGVYYRLRDPYTPEQHRVIESAMNEVDQALMQHGWPPLPMHLYSYNYENFTSAPVSHRRQHQSQPSHQPSDSSALTKGTSGGDQQNDIRGEKRKAKSPFGDPSGGDNESNVIKLSPWMKNR